MISARVAARGARLAFLASPGARAAPAAPAAARLPALARGLPRARAASTEAAAPAAASTRPSSAGVSLDVRLVAEQPELVLAHLRARRAIVAGGEVPEGEQPAALAVARIGELKRAQNDLGVEARARGRARGGAGLRAARRDRRARRGSALGSTLSVSL